MPQMSLYLNDKTLEDVKAKAAAWPTRARCTTP